MSELFIRPFEFETQEHRTIAEENLLTTLSDMIESVLTYSQSLIDTATNKEMVERISSFVDEVEAGIKSLNQFLEMVIRTKNTKELHSLCIKELSIVYQRITSTITSFFQLAHPS